MRPRSRASPRSRRPSSVHGSRIVDLASFQAQLDALRVRALASIADAASPDALAEVDASVLGRKGALRALLGGIGALPAEDRPRVGALANPIREEVEAALVARRERL